MFCILLSHMQTLSPFLGGKNLGRCHFWDKHSLPGELSDGGLTLNNGHDNMIIVVCHGDAIVDNDHSDLICL